MNETFQKLVETTEDLKALGRKISDSGIGSVQGVFDSFGIVRSLFAAKGEADRDETHYFLLPDFTGAKSGHIYSTRVLPEGVLSENSLPKARVFHIAGDGGKERIESILEEQLKISLSEKDKTSNFVLAEALGRFAEKIDAQSNTLSGGIMLVGGAVTIFNPLAGIGISLAGWAAGVGTKASVAGTEYLSEKVRLWSEAKRDRAKSSIASKSVQSMKPEIYGNPILSSLEMIASELGGDYDPFLDQATWVDEFDPRSYYSLSVIAVAAVYDSRDALGSISKVHRSWIESLSQEP